MKAYKAFCTDDDHGCEVIFADRMKDVDRRGSGYNCDCSFIDRRVKRIPDFDKYSPGPVTKQNCLDEGWFFECSGACNKYVYVEDKPLVNEDCVFCSVECLKRTLKECEKSDKKHESYIRFEESAKRLLPKEQPCNPN